MRLFKAPTTLQAGIVSELAMMLLPPGGAL
jgi:hypothetical protein